MTVRREALFAAFVVAASTALIASIDVVSAVGKDSPTTTTTTPHRVLVLGSGGLIGRGVVKWLKQNSYEVFEVKNRNHIDLRIPTALDVFNDKKIDFVIFLACEVGGAKFLESSNTSIQLEIVENNVLIYQTVFPWLAKTKTNFLFTSSYLQSQSNAYGTIKRLGERWIEGIGIGKIARLWNVYGHEPISLKSHVLADWVAQCVQNGTINCQTDGKEARQFMHVDDCAAALGAMMRTYQHLSDVTDLSTGRWVTLRHVASLIQQHSPQPCNIEYTDRQAVARVRLSPDQEIPFYDNWKPTITLEEGVDRLFKDYQLQFNVNSNEKREHKSEL